MTRSSGIPAEMRVSLLTERSIVQARSTHIRPRKDEGNFRGTPKKCAAGSCYDTSLLSRCTEKGDNGRRARSPIWWFCASSTKRQLLHSITHGEQRQWQDIHSTRVLLRRKAVDGPSHHWHTLGVGDECTSLTHSLT